MTKKQFIWLGIRVLGIYWLVKLILGLGPLLWLIGFYLFPKTTPSHTVNFTGILITHLLLHIPVPLFLSLYFLFGGNLVYRFINHFTHVAADVLQPQDYSQIIVRLFGLWCIGLIIASLFGPLFSVLRSVSMIYFNYPEQNLHRLFLTSIRDCLDIRSISSIAVYCVLLIILAWYFLKKGTLCIDFLNRFRVRKQSAELTISTSDSGTQN